MLTHGALAEALSMEGKHDEALAEVERISIAPLRDVLRATLLARAGRRNEAIALARDLERRPADASLRLVDLGRLYLLSESQLFTAAL